jgi:hypothetical protein
MQVPHPRASYLLTGGVVFVLGPLACVELTGASDLNVVDSVTDGGFSADSDQSAMPPDTGTTCDPGMTFCGTKCVDTKSDNANCGGCEQPCAADRVCNDGTCSTTCAEGFTKCPDGACYDLTKTATHCGSCTNSCGTDQDCHESSCVPRCVAPTDTQCAGTCVDVKTDSDHCGACGAACETGATCVAGACATTVTFPSTDSTLYMTPSGSTKSLGSGGCSSYWTAGSYVEKVFDRKAPIDHVDATFVISACLGACGTSANYSFEVSIDGVVVGTVDLKGAGPAAQTFTQTFAFAPMTPPGGKVTLRITGTKTVCSGGGVWGFNPGGSFRLY